MLNNIAIFHLDSVAPLRGFVHASRSLPFRQRDSDLRLGNVTIPVEWLANVVVKNFRWDMLILFFWETHIFRVVRGMVVLIPLHFCIHFLPRGFVLHRGEGDVSKVFEVIKRIRNYVIFSEKRHRSCRHIWQPAILQLRLGESTFGMIFELWKRWLLSYSKLWINLILQFQKLWWLSVSCILLLLSSNLLQFGNLLCHSSELKEVIPDVIWSLIWAHSSLIQLVYWRISYSLLMQWSVDTVVEPLV